MKIQKKNCVWGGGSGGGGGGFGLWGQGGCENIFFRGGGEGLVGGVMVDGNREVKFW